MIATVEQVPVRDRAISVEVFVPKVSGRHPACLVLHGTTGLTPEDRPDIVSFAEALAEAGVVAMLPHYFESTKTEPGLPAMRVLESELPQWKEACGQALIFARGHERVSAGRLGVVGFSLGGHIALTLALSPPTGTTLKGVVDFFGPVVSPPLVGNRASMPPVLIHHGERDEIVSFNDSRQLVSELQAAGKTEGVGYTFVRYPTQGHRFTGADLVSSRAKTIAFMKATL